MFSLDGRPQENTGNVIGAALCYSGNYKLRIETHDDEYHHFFAGINEENSTYSLKKDELFRTQDLSEHPEYLQLSEYRILPGADG